jgi:hypothetical protein
MAEKDFIQSNGIPLRTVACNCLLGQTRDIEDFVEPDEQFTNWEGIVGASLRDPQHTVIGVKYVDKTNGTANDGFNDDAKALCTVLAPFQNYPSSVSGASKPDLIIKARGKIKWKDGDPVFPAIKIQLRPYKCVLDYTYQGNLNKSGQGEVGYETKAEEAGASPADDIWEIWRFEGEVPPNFFSDYEGHYAAIKRNQERAEIEFQEVGKMLTLNETHYFKNSDRPPDEETPWEAVPDWCPNPTLYPRANTGEPYDLKRNESWDCRYRFPDWWFDANKNVTIFAQGHPLDLPEISFDGFQQFPFVPAEEWQSKPVPTANTTIHDNPFFDPKTTNHNYDGVAPVIKGFYVDGEFPKAGGWKALANSTAIKGYKYIRKRYSFSFSLEGKNPLSQINVPDNTVGAQGVGDYYNNYYQYQRYPLTYTVQRMEELRNQSQIFDCECWWRMEISAPLAEWNYDKKNKKGTTISGWILLNKRFCDAPSPENGNKLPYQPAWVGGFISSYYWYGSNDYYWGWYGYWMGTLPIVAGTQFIFSEKFPPLPAGEIPWSVTISDANSKMKDDGKDVFFPFFDFPIGGSIWVSDGEGGYTEIRCGDPIENGASYISDFIVTSITLP